MKRNYLKLFICLCLCFLLFFNAVVPISALEFNGESGASGGGGATGSFEYGVATNGTALCGFRFSLIDSSNEQKGNSVDVITDDRYSEYKSSRKFDVKKSKAWWVSRYSAIGSLTSSTINTNFYKQSSMGFDTSLPQITSLTDIDNLASNIETWQQNGNNIDAVLSKIAYSNVPSVDKIGTHKILIEPLIRVYFAGKIQHIVTTTELAVYGGGFEYNGSFTTIPKSSSNIGSWEFISNYTNMHIPNYMRTETADCNWGAAPRLSARISFANVITKGYGVHVLSAADMGIKTYTVSFDTNGATSGSINEQEMEINVSEALNIGTLKKEYTITYDGNGGTPSNVSSLAAAPFIGWQDHNSITNSTTGETYPWYTFNAPFYSNYYSDLYEAFGYDKSALLNHWLWQTVYGSENRTSSEVFNVAHYLNTGGASLNVTDKSVGVRHWSNHGYYEGRVGINKVIVSDKDVYPAGATVKNLSNVLGTKITLKAKWGEASATLETASKPGCVFTGWNTEKDGSGKSYQAGDKYVATGDITLYAQWISADTTQYVIKYVGNGATKGSEWTEFADLSEGNVYKLSSDTSAFERFENNADTGVNTLFKFMGWKIGDTVYDFGEEVPSEVLLAHAETSTDEDNLIVTIYAYWDEFPVIDGSDRWFTLDEAKDGSITLEELLKTSEAIDGEIGDVTDFSKGEGTFTIIDYDEDEFKKFSATGSVTVTCLAVDKVGNETYRTITVHIVSEDFMPTDSTVQYVRFIGKKYYKSNDGTSVTEDAGGLNYGSVWINIYEYEKLLTETLNNKQDSETGEWAKVYQTLILKKDQIAEVKTYVKEHGLGKTKETDALTHFYNLYLNES